jgi:hypothetical protein
MCKMQSTKACAGQCALTVNAHNAHTRTTVTRHTPARGQNERKEMKNATILNRLTGVMEQVSPVAEAAYHIALCVFDLDDPSASRQRKRRAATALVYWRGQLQERTAPK